MDNQLSQEQGGKDAATLWEAYTLTLNLHWRGSKSEEGACAAFMATVNVLGPSFPVSRVDARVVSSLVEGWRRAGQAGGTINRKLAALSRVCRVAHQAGMTVVQPGKFLRLKERPHRTRVVTPDELERMRAASGITYGRLWLFLHETGLRVSEALALEWADLHLGGRVEVRESKSGSPRTVPMTSAANSVAWDSLDLDRPFPMTQRAVNAEWDAARRVLVLQDDPEFVPHALRHTCATNLVSRGVPLAVVQRWLGHKSIAVTMRYAHVGDAQVMDAVKVLENPIQRFDKKGREEL